MNTNSKILVTGAGGFIGGWLVEAMHLAGFTGVRAGIRRWGSAARIGRFPVEIVPCDILNKQQVDQAVQGVDAIVHCAIGSPEAMVKGTENMLEAALKHGVDRFIHFSTVDVYGDNEGSIDETTPLKHTEKVYGNLKIDAENLCWEYHKRGLPVVVLRPSIVYGPFAKLWIGKFAERIRSGQWGNFKELGEGKCNLVYIQDVVQAVFLSLESEKAVGHAFNINGSDIVTWNDYFAALNSELGLPPLREIAPSKSKGRAALLMPVKATAKFALKRFNNQIIKLSQKSNMLRSFMKRTERTMKMSPSGDEFKMFGRKPHYTISKAKALLGYEPAFSVHDGVAMSIRWLKHESLVSMEER